VREAKRRRAAEKARLARDRAAKLAAAQRFQAAQAHRVDSTPEELGYYTTDDSFTKIIDDAAEQLGERLRRSDAKKQFTRRLSDLFGRDA
jgi:type VI protein secretion system component VasK